MSFIKNTMIFNLMGITKRTKTYYYYISLHSDQQIASLITSKKALGFELFLFSNENTYFFTRINKLIKLRF